MGPHIRSVALVAALALGASACAALHRGDKPQCSVAPAAVPTGTGSMPSSPGPPLPRFGRVVVVVMENKDYGDVIGSPDAPYINSLARRYGLAADFFAVSHPSLPNYLAMTGGSTFGISSDCSADPRGSIAVTNLVDQLEGAGISWKAYMEDLPSPCYRGTTSDGYAQKHDPFVYYRDIVTDPARCSRIVPLSELNADLRGGTLPRFVWITPNLCHDMHDCSVREGDAFLSRLLPPLLSALGPEGVLFLVWDEAGGSKAGCCEVAAGGHIPAVVAGPLVSPGTTSSRSYDLYSILRTIEDAWGLPELGQAACPCTRSMRDFFSPS